MRNLLYTPIFGLVLFLAACSTSTVGKVTVACNGYAATLNSLTAYKMAGSLSDEQIAVVNMWEPMLTAACTGGPENVSSDVLDMIDEAMFALIQVERSAK